MRYASAPYAETTRLIGRLNSGRTLGQVTMKLVNLATGAVETLSDDDCVELANTTLGGFSVYAWPTSNITTQPTSYTEYLFIMTDTVTGFFVEGKIALGGYLNDALISRRHLTNRRRLDPTTTPWQEVVYDDNESSEIQRANLKDTAGANITNSNKPSGVIVGERDPV